MLSRGPYRYDDELGLLRHHQIDALVTKNSGGAMTRPAGCRVDTGVAVVMVTVPALPPNITTVTTVDDAVAWVGQGRLWRWSNERPPVQQIRHTDVRPRAGPILHDRAYHGRGAPSPCGHCSLSFRPTPCGPWLFGAILLIAGLIIMRFTSTGAAPRRSSCLWRAGFRHTWRASLTVPAAYNAAGNALYRSGATAVIYG